MTKCVSGNYKNTNCERLVPELCREQGRTITIDSTREQIHISKANVVPKDSPFKKLIRLEGICSDSDTFNNVEHILSGQGQTGTEESCDTDLSGCSEYIDDTNNIYDELVSLLPKVIDTLKEHGKMQEFLSFNRLLSEDKFPLDNIAFLLFLDVVRWLSLEETATRMRYSDEVKCFWRTGLRLFHGRFLRFMGGPKTRDRSCMTKLLRVT